jgi:hypothetical protein
MQEQQPQHIMAWVSLGLAVLRATGAIGVFIGASWVAVEWLDQRLTARIIASTEAAMKHPIVTQEVDALFIRTAQRLLADPATERQMADFLTAVAKEGEVQEASLSILAGTLLSPQFKAAGTQIMKELALMVLEDSAMREKLGRLSSGIATALEEANFVERHKLNIELPALQPAVLFTQPRAHFTPSLDLVHTEALRLQVRQLGVVEVRLPAFHSVSFTPSRMLINF